MNKGQMKKYIEKQMCRVIISSIVKMTIGLFITCKCFYVFAYVTKEVMDMDALKAFVLLAMLLAFFVSPVYVACESCRKDIKSVATCMSIRLQAEKERSER